MEGTATATRLGSSWHSYPSIFNLGHKAIRELLNRDVYVEEKVDGSQFSFGLFPDDPYGPLLIRSKGAMQHIDAPEGMFKFAAQTVKRLHAEGKLVPGWTYRCEYLAKPKHNALAYNRIPTAHLILFDVTVGEEEYLPYEDKAAVAEWLGLEVVPLLYQGRVEHVEQMRSFLQQESVLGGQKIEGVVVKPIGYAFYGVDHKVLLGKFVSEAFREVHKQEWKKDNPTTGDTIAMLAAQYTTPARWNKCVQHLRDDGAIAGDSVKDIGPVMKEIPEDIKRECAEDIKNSLFRAFWPEIARRVRQGFPEFYKDQLMRAQFEQPAVLLPVGRIDIEEEAGPDAMLIPHRPTEAEWVDIGRPEHGMGAEENE